ncbi:MAG TPA: hypothetical protein VH478_15970 [Trebonia sp.]|nr:hypothetical protein [Trebonia sp.]
MTPAPSENHYGAEAGNEPTYKFTPHVTCTALEAPAAKACKTVNYDLSGGDGYKAVECTDIYVNTNHAASSIQVYTVGSFSCQTPTSQYENCGTMIVSSEVAYKFQGNGSASGSGSNPTCTCSDAGPPRRPGPLASSS